MRISLTPDPDGHGFPIVRFKPAWNGVQFKYISFYMFCKEKLFESDINDLPELKDQLSTRCVPSRTVKEAKSPLDF
jgi:hypothetical protein